MFCMTCSPACVPTRVCRLPSTLLFTLLTVRLPKCKTKTAVLPARCMDEWSRALSLSPFLSTAVVGQCRYFGAMRAPPALYPLLEAPAAMRLACEAAQQGTWQGALGKLKARSDALLRHRASPAQRAVLWNLYAASLAVYLALLFLPPARLPKACSRPPPGLTGPKGGCPPRC